MTNITMQYNHSKRSKKLSQHIITMFRNIIIILLIMFFVYIFLNKITTEGFSNKKRKNCPSDNPECTSNIGDTGISPLSPEMLEQARRDAEDLRKRQKTAASDAKKRKEQEEMRKAAEKRRIAEEQARAEAERQAKLNEENRLRNRSSKRFNNRFGFFGGMNFFRNVHHAAAAKAAPKPAPPQRRR